MIDRGVRLNLDKIKKLIKEGRKMVERPHLIEFLKSKSVSSGDGPTNLVDISSKLVVKNENLS